MAEQDFALERALTDFERSWHGISRAFMRVALKTEMGSIGRDVDHTVALLRELKHVDRDQGIDRHAVRMAFYAFVGFMAHKTGATPREVLEEQFKLAPTDDEWLNRLGGGNDAAEAPE